MRPTRITVLQRLKRRGVRFSPFDLSAIGNLASVEYRKKTGRTPYKIRQKEQYGFFRVAAYPQDFLRILDTLTDAFLAIPEEKRKETMNSALNAEEGPLEYLAPGGLSMAPPRRRRRRRRPPGEDDNRSNSGGSTLAYSTRD